MHSYNNLQAIPHQKQAGTGNDTIQIKEDSRPLSPTRCYSIPSSIIHDMQSEERG